MAELGLDLLDMDLDELEDLKGFDPLNVGTHLVTVKWTAKDINGKTNYELEMTLEETLEKADPEVADQAPGFSSSVLFSTESEIGRGKLKAVLLPFAAHYGVKNIPALMEAMQGSSVQVLIGHRPDKNDPAKKYTDIKAMQPV